MKIAKMKVIRSTSNPLKMSLRNREGGSPRTAITNAGFEEWKDVVLISQKDFDNIIEILALYEGLKNNG